MTAPDRVKVEAVLGRTLRSAIDFHEFKKNHIVIVEEGAI